MLNWKVDSCRQELVEQEVLEVNQMVDHSSQKLSSLEGLMREGKYKYSFAPFLPLMCCSTYKTWRDIFRNYSEDEEETVEHEPLEFRELRNQIVSKMRQFAVGSNHDHPVSANVPGGGMSSQSIAPAPEDRKPPPLTMAEQRLVSIAEQRAAALSLVQAAPPAPPPPDSSASTHEQPQID
jgi:hypothetical protein